MYYQIIGPTIVANDPDQLGVPERVWLDIRHWANQAIVAEAVKQDTAEPGLMYDIVWKPQHAPKDINKIRMPKEWTREIPGLNVIDKDFEEQWTTRIGPEGQMMVIRR